MKRTKEPLKERIEKIVRKTYKKYGAKDVETFDVIVGKDNELIVEIDSEIPYLDRKFFDFLGEVKEKIEEEAKTEGYEFKRTKFMYSFCYLHFELSVSSKEI